MSECKIFMSSMFSYFWKLLIKYRNKTIYYNNKPKSCTIMKEIDNCNKDECLCLIMTILLISIRNRGGHIGLNYKRWSNWSVIYHFSELLNRKVKILLQIKFYFLFSMRVAVYGNNRYHKVIWYYLYWDVGLFWFWGRYYCVDRKFKYNVYASAW